MTDINDDSEGKGKNDGLESKALDGSENVIKSRIDLKKIVSKIKREMRDREDKGEREERLRITVRMDPKKEKAVGDLEWRWNLTKAKRFIRTGLIVTGLANLEIQDEMIKKKTENMYNMYAEVRRSFDEQAHEVLERRGRGTSGLKREVFLTEAESGHISILSEVLGITFESMVDILCSISLYDVEDISPRNKRNWQEQSDDFIRFLSYRESEIKNVCNMMNENKSNNN